MIWSGALGVSIPSVLFDRPCGGVGEWLNPPDCKSGRLAYVGSNPTPSTIIVCAIVVQTIETFWFSLLELG